MRGVLRARQGRGNHKDKVVKPGKDGDGRRTEPEEWNMGGGELKEPWGIQGRDEQEGASVERNGLGRRTWKESGGPDSQERRYFSHPHLKDRTGKIMLLRSCLDTIPGALLRSFVYQVPTRSSQNVWSPILSWCSSTDIVR